jgi:SsrA-binding protein
LNEITYNKAVNFNYDIIKIIEAGIILNGNEVKSIRDKHISIKEAYCSISNGEAFLKQAHIAKFDSANTFTTIDETRQRKLLLNKKEIAELYKMVTQSGLTIVPRSVYINDKNLIKVQICLVKGKKDYDKREDIKKRENDRELRRVIKDKNK